MGVMGYHNSGLKDWYVLPLAGYQAAYGRVPTAPGGALSYDALQLLFETVRKAASTKPGDISERLRALDRFEGVTGVMVFEGSPDPRKSVVIVRVQEGKPAFLTRVDP